MNRGSGTTTEQLRTLCASIEDGGTGVYVVGSQKQASYIPSLIAKHFPDWIRENDASGISFSGNLGRRLLIRTIAVRPHSLRGVRRLRVLIDPAAFTQNLSARERSDLSDIVRFATEARS